MAGPSPSRDARRFVAFITEAARCFAKAEALPDDSEVVYFFAPQLAIALELDVDPSTMWRWFRRYPQVRALVASRPVKTSVSGHNGARTMIAGSVWGVRLRGEGDVRVPYAELKRHRDHRDLEHDIEHGNTLTKRFQERTRARREGLQASTQAVPRTRAQELHQDQSALERVLRWAFRTPAEPAVVDACSSLVDGVLAVQAGESPAVLARVVARELRDEHSLVFWTSQVRRWRDRGRLWAFRDSVERVLVDVREGVTHRAAPKLVDRLKAAEVRFAAAATDVDLARAHGVALDRSDSVEAVTDRPAVSVLERPPSMAWFAEALDRALGMSGGGGLAAAAA